MRLAVLVALLSTPTAALASGSLVISLQDDRSRAIEGTATASPAAGGGTRSCTTRGGRCTVTGLTAGSYRVSATLVRGGSPPSQSVQVRDGRASSVRLTAAPQPTAPMGSATLRSGSPTATAPSGTTGPVRPGVGPVSPVPTGPRSPTASRLGTRLTPIVPGGTQPPVASPTAPRSGPVLMTGSTTTMVSRDLGAGTRVRITGVTQDQRSRRVEGTVTVRQGTSTLGQVATTGGSFSIFDLEPGSYSLTFAAVSGQRTSRSVTVGSGPAISVRFQVSR